MENRLAHRMDAAAYEEGVRQKEEALQNEAAALFDESGAEFTGIENSEEENCTLAGNSCPAGCSAVGYQDVDVCIPVTIKPYGEVGNARTRCLGAAVVSADCDKCPGRPGAVFKFTITQKLRVEVPVVFGARAEVGEAFASFE